MTSPQRKVTAELKKWQRKTFVEISAVEGFVHNDKTLAWKDGQLGLIYPVVWWEETTHYWFAHTNTATYECAKDEEIVDGQDRAPPI